MKKARVSVKQLQDKVRLINNLTNYKYDLRLWVTTGCGVDLKINGEWQTEKYGLGRNFTNKELYKILSDKFDKEIREIVINISKQETSWEV